ncbi:MAG: STAS domain-containing protein [Clostridiales bacterium]|nr:STAS domain-containing protein [Clostridiales bacterium]
MNYRIDTQNGIMDIILLGEMDHHSAKTAREEIDAAITFESPMILRLDLSSIRFCDSAGLGFIMGRYRKMQTIGGSLTLVNPSDSVVRILKLAGFDKLIRTETTK